MTVVAITGADGFIGRNLRLHLQNLAPVEVLSITRADTAESTRTKLGRADFVYHLAGSNRPEETDEFYQVNRDFTREIVDHLLEEGRTPPIVFASSTQAERDNDYGRSKREGEEVLEEWARNHGGTVLLYRLTNVFGKWSRPHYNSVVATFCHEIARDNPIEIHDPDTPLLLVHVDDVVAAFLRHLEDQAEPGVHRPVATPEYEIRLGELADRIRSFREIRDTLKIPDLSDRFSRLLHGAFISYLPEDEFAYALQERRDERGKLAELLKSDTFGQIFVSTTRPGVVRGNHYHHSKVEKFCVLKGEGEIRFRRVGGEEVLRYPVSGREFRVVDIPPGYTHDIENVGEEDMVVLFWANEVFDPDSPDTFYLDVEA